MSRPYVWCIWCAAVLALLTTVTVDTAHLNALAPARQAGAYSGQHTRATINLPVGYQPSVAQVASRAAEEALTPFCKILVAPLPKGWKLDLSVSPDKMRWRMTFDNFESDYLPGGIIPSGGAEVLIVADANGVSIPANDLERYLDGLVAAHLSGDRKLSTKAIQVDRCSARYAESESTFAPQVTYRNDAVFLPLRQEDRFVIYKFLLSYHADAGATEVSAFNESFKALLQSARRSSAASCTR